MPKFGEQRGDGKIYWSCGRWHSPEVFERKRTVRLRSLKEWKSANRSKHRMNQRKAQTSYREKHPDNNHSALRRVREKCQGSRSFISQFYVTARRMTRCMGIKWHVDHEIPLARGGLHHENNLRVITAGENLSKGARIAV